MAMISVKKEQLKNPNEPIRLATIHIKRINIAFDDLQTAVNSSEFCEDLVKTLRTEISNKLNSLMCAIEKVFEENTNILKKLPESELYTPKTTAEQNSTSVPSNILPVSTNKPPLLSSISQIASSNQSLTLNNSSTDYLQIFSGRVLRNLRRKARRNENRKRLWNGTLTSTALSENNDNSTKMNNVANSSNIETTCDGLDNTTAQHSEIPKNKDSTSTIENDFSNNIPKINEEIEEINKILGETPTQQSAILRTETSTLTQDYDNDTTGTFIEKNDADVKDTCHGGGGELNIKTVQHATIPKNKTVKSYTPFQNALLQALLKSSLTEETDYDKAFLVSLLPFIKKMNDEQKMEIRFQYLEIIRKISKSNTTSILPSPCTAPFPKAKSFKSNLPISKPLNPNQTNNSFCYPQQNAQQPIPFPQNNSLRPLIPFPQQNTTQSFPPQPQQNFQQPNLFPQ